MEQGKLFLKFIGYGDPVYWSDLPPVFKDYRDLLRTAYCREELISWDDIPEKHRSDKEIAYLTWQ